MKGGEAARKRNSPALPDLITKHDKDFPFIFIYLMLPLWKFVTMSEYVQKNQPIFFDLAFVSFLPYNVVCA